MSKKEPSIAARIALFGLAVLFTAWALAEALRFLASVWWQLAILGVVLLAVFGAYVWWKWRRDSW